MPVPTPNTKQTTVLEHLFLPYELPFLNLNYTCNEVIIESYPSSNRPKYFAQKKFP